MRASYQNIYFHSHSLKKKTDKNKLNSSLHFVMARCDKQDSDSTLSPAKHSSTTEDRHKRLRVEDTTTDKENCFGWIRWEKWTGEDFI